MGRQRVTATNDPDRGARPPRGDGGRAARPMQPRLDVPEAAARSPLREAAVLSLLLVVAAAATSANDGWPDWRGPTLNRSVDASGLPVAWSESENLCWKTALPDRSGATPIVSQGTIFLNVGEGEQLELWALDERDGSLRWKRAIGAGNERKHKQNMSSPSPVSDGEHVWVVTGTGVVKALDFAGQEVWKRDLQEDYGDFGLNWGYASSPFLHRGVLYVQVLHGMRTDDPSYVVAIEAESGDNRWRVERPTDARAESPDSYTTPALLQRGAGELVISGGDYVTGHALDDGRELWRVGGLNPEKHGMYRVVASPVVVGRTIFVPSRVRPLLALRAESEEYGAEPEVLFELDRGTDVPTPAANQDYLFVLSDNGILRRIDAKTGEETWDEPQRLAQGNYSASPLLADGKLYATSEDGVTSVVAAYGDFEELAVNKLEGFTLSSLAVSRGRIYQRTDQALYCIGGASEVP